jgi:hypothetical protein
MGQLVPLRPGVFPSRAGGAHASWLTQYLREDSLQLTWSKGIAAARADAAPAGAGGGATGAGGYGGKRAEQQQQQSGGANSEQENSEQEEFPWEYFAPSQQLTHQPQQPQPQMQRVAAGGVRPGAWGGLPGVPLCFLDRVLDSAASDRGSIDSRSPGHAQVSAGAQSPQLSEKDVYSQEAASAGAQLCGEDDVDVYSREQQVAADDEQLREGFECEYVPREREIEMLNTLLFDDARCRVRRDVDANNVERNATMKAPTTAAAPAPAPGAWSPFPAGAPLPLNPLVALALTRQMQGEEGEPPRQRRGLQQLLLQQQQKQQQQQQQQSGGWLPSAAAAMGATFHNGDDFLPPYGNNTAWLSASAGVGLLPTDEHTQWWGPRTS